MAVPQGISREATLGEPQSIHQFVGLEGVQCWAVVAVQGAGKLIYLSALDGLNGGKGLWEEQC